MRARFAAVGGVTGVGGRLCACVFEGVHVTPGLHRACIWIASIISSSLVHAHLSKSHRETP